MNEVKAIINVNIAAAWALCDECGHKEVKWPNDLRLQVRGDGTHEYVCLKENYMNPNGWSRIVRSGEQTVKLCRACTQDLVLPIVAQLPKVGAL